VALLVAGSTMTFWIP